ncbi:uncharacterized protein V6R79_004448 [Siganus canaliculatus]
MTTALTAAIHHAVKPPSSEGPCTASFTSTPNVSDVSHNKAFEPQIGHRCNQPITPADSGPDHLPGGFPLAALHAAATGAFYLHKPEINFCSSSSNRVPADECRRLMRSFQCTRRRARCAKQIKNTECE